MRQVSVLRGPKIKYEFDPAATNTATRSRLCQLKFPSSVGCGNRIISVSGAIPSTAIQVNESDRYVVKKKKNGNSGQ